VNIWAPTRKYNVIFTRGPEYIRKAGKSPFRRGGFHYANVKLKRWIIWQTGMVSADHHVHAAGCSHYEVRRSVSPAQCCARYWRDFKYRRILTWGPSCTSENFFTGEISPLLPKKIMRYDVEVSGSLFAAGQCALTYRKDYTGYNTIWGMARAGRCRIEWPSRSVLRLPIGMGLEPYLRARLPIISYPKWIIRSQYISYSTQIAMYMQDTPAPGTERGPDFECVDRLSGETDSCIFDER